MPERDEWEHLKELFNRAVEWPEEEQKALIHKLESENPALARRLSELLGADTKADKFLSRPIYEACEENLKIPLRAPRAPERIGPYRIRGHLDAGGMGTVYEAVQEHPERVVALKVLKRALLSDTAFRRFEYESKILGRLQHRGIAQVYDAGHDEDGLPYFAMEYIPGAKPITHYARDSRLDTRARLGLFLEVCEAIHHGHQKGIIHRDLKPANVLVDAKGQPKVIDYGVACVVDDMNPETSLHTRTGQFIGTLGYMSPEQCEGRSKDIDIRTDVYSLGALLYELLCERPPHDLRGLSLPASVRVIREETPERPSQHKPALKGDLETILEKALEKEPPRRYPSAEDLRRDVIHYLEMQPIDARPPSALYHLKKFVIRNKVPSAFAATSVVSLIGFAIVMWMFSRELKNERDLLENANRRAEQNLVAIERESRLKKDQELIARKNFDAFARALGFDRSFSPRRELGSYAKPNQSWEQTLESALLAMKSGDNEDPEYRAKVLMLIGEELRSLGLLARARPHLEEALELRQAVLRTDHADLALSHRSLARLDYSEGHLDQALDGYQAALAAFRRTSSREDVSTHFRATLFEMVEIYDILGDTERAGECLNEAYSLHIRRPDTQGAQLFERLTALWSRQLQEGKFGEAKINQVRLVHTFLQETEAVDDPTTMALFLDYLGIVDMKMGFLPAAASLFRQSLKLRTENLGIDHLAIAESLHHFGLLMLITDQLELADRFFNWALRIRRESLGPIHRDVLTTELHLATLRRTEGLHDQAEALGHRVLDVVLESPSSRDPLVPAALMSLAETRLAQRKELGEASFLLDMAECRIVDIYGEEHLEYARFLEIRGTADLEAAEPEQAIARFHHALSLREALQNPEHPDVAFTLERLAYANLRAQDLEACERYLLAALKVSRLHFLHTHRLPLTLLSHWVHLSLLRRHIDDVRPMAHIVFRLQISRQPTELPVLSRSMAEAAQTLARWFRQEDQEWSPDEVAVTEELLRGAYAIARPFRPDRHPHDASILISLAEVVSFRGGREEASHLLESAQDLLNRWPDAVPQSRLQAEKLREQWGASTETAAND